MSKMPELPKALNIENHSLSNGMRVLICQRPELHRICMLVNVASGCRNERLPGTAHMLEHLIFRGSKQYPSLRELSEAFENLGADFNAYTAREVTSFDVSMPAQSLIPVVYLLGDVLSTPKLQGIAAERDIIREEIIGDYDADKTLINVDDWIVSLFYGDAGKPIAGDPDDLANISRAEVMAFYEAHYAASNILIVAAGPVGDSAEFIQALEHAFEPIRANASIWKARNMPECYRSALESGIQVNPRLCIKKYDGATQSELSVGFLCGPTLSQNFSALEMLVRVLDDGMASRLSRRLVEELALVYDAEAFLSTTRESTLMQIRASCRHRRVCKVIDAIYGLLREIAEGGVNCEEFDRLRCRVVWEHEGMLDGAPQLTQWLSTMKLQQMPCDIRVHCENLLAVTVDDIRRMAEDLLTRRPHITAIVGDIGTRGAEEIRSVMQNHLKCNEIKITAL